jgi:hypothetical protein
MKVKASSPRQRSAAMWNIEAETPTGPFRIISGRTQRTADDTDDLYFLQAEEASGSATEFCCRARDFRKCTDEWGDDTDNWGWCFVRVTPGTKKGMLFPCDPQPKPIEKVIGE